MAEPYLRDLKSIVERAAVPCEEVAHITCKHFFSGAAAYIDGRIFMTLTPVGLALKLPEDGRNRLLDQGGKPLRYFPKAPVKKDYVLSPSHLIDDDVGLSAWISRSIEFVWK